MNVKKLQVYQKAFDLSDDIFNATKNFPKEETYSLTDQIRRASRSVCVGIAEAYRRKEDESYFVDAISDAEKAINETIVWLDFVRSSRYLSKKKQRELDKKSAEVGKMLSHMIRYPKKYTTQ